MNRRALFQLVGGTAFAALSGRRQLPAAGRDTLARVLGLALGEEAWLNDLTRSEQRELYLYLSGEGGGPPSRRAVDLAARVISRRSRLFAFVRYPVLGDERVVCDGLIRE